MSNKKNNAMRKVAILVDSLDRHTADALLDTLSDQQAAQVRDVLVDLEPIHEEERERILNEFFDAGGRPAAAGDEAASSEAVALELSSASREALEHAPTATIIPTARTTPTATPPLATPPTTPPGLTLDQAPVPTLVAFLQKEHAQVAALVIAHLPRTKAAQVLQAFSSQEQVELARRIIDLRETDPSIIQAVENALAATLAESIEEQRRRVSGRSVLQEILSSSNGAARESLLDNLAQEGVSLRTVQLPFTPEPPADQATHAPPPTPKPESGTIAAPASEVQEISPPSSLGSPPEKNLQAAGLPEFAFDDLAKLDKKSLYRVLGESPELALLALAGASTELVAHISRGLTTREANAMRRGMEQLGPIRLRDVEQAQLEIAKLVEQLARQGEIKLPVTRRFAAAA